MYRRALFSLYQARKAIISAQEPPTCAARSSGARVFGTSAARVCEQKKDGERTEEMQVETRRRDGVEEHKCKVKRDESSVKAADRKESGAEAKSQNTESEKTTGKRGLLELLGAMKVETTTKTKVKSLRKSGQENMPMESTSSMFQQATKSSSPAATHSESLSPELVAAVSAAASTLPDRSRVESELLKQLRKHEAVSEERPQAETQNIGNIISKMKVGKKPAGRMNSWPSNQIRFDDDGQGYKYDHSIMRELAETSRRKFDLTGKRLNMFSAADQETPTDLTPGPSLWDADLADQMARAVNQRPRNGFEEMIQWTREGKLWSYPINNEAGMEAEAKVPFQEHVFLQRHLEDGFPQHGPVRHFMELVMVGLAKNHHLALSQKLEHINWFRQYFLEKQGILKEAEA